MAGRQEASAYNGHFGCMCYHPLFLLNEFGDRQTPPSSPWQRCGIRLSGERKWLPDTRNPLGRWTQGGGAW